MKDHVVDEARDDRLDPVGLVLVRLYDLVEEGQGLDLIGCDDLLRLFRGELALETRFRRFEFRPLGFERLHPLADRGHRILAAFGHDIDQPAELGPDAGKLGLHPLKIRTELGEGLGGGLVRLLARGADALGFQVELPEEFEDRAVKGLGRDVALGACAARRLLRGNAVVVVVILAAPPLPGLGGHLVAAAPAAEQSLEKVDVLARLAAVAVVPAVVPVHQGLDLLVDFPGPDGLPEGIEELALVFLLPRVHHVPEHPAKDGLDVELPRGRPIAALPEFPDKTVHALEFEVERVGRIDMREEPLIGSEDLPHPLHSDGRGADGESLLDPPEDLVPHASRGHLALVLSQGHEDHGDEPTGRGREVDVLPERDELDVVLLKRRDELEEVGHVPRDPLEARDHDHVDHPRLGELEEFLVSPRRLKSDGLDLSLDLRCTFLPKVVVEGRVVQEDTSLPVPGAMVSLVPDFSQLADAFPEEEIEDAQTSLMAGPVRTDGTGAFKTIKRLHPAKYVLTARHNQFGSYDGEIDPRGQITVLAHGDQNYVFEVRLTKPKESRVQGTCVSRAGVPVHGAYVTLLDGGIERQALTDDQGRFEVGVANRSVSVVIRHAEYRTERFTSDGPASVTRIMDRKELPVELTIVDQAGTPLALNTLHVAEADPARAEVNPFFPVQPKGGKCQFFAESAHLYSFNLPDGSSWSIVDVKASGAHTRKFDLFQFKEGGSSVVVTLRRRE